ncbi:putative C-C chemokine receptor type 3 [Oryzias melastigma]|uniref:Putative C-C chemokine receptor type 3 n=1 Tax=Oryzias melastigma TaxID=30732 RepID=A0A834C4U8_ORYME|nr:probable C-C chemokine receptor type 3 [Oryzias melastigma]KAF6725443.1 putative C-C chemokine receptor type 3 [Oryzias melastigma]
MAGDNISAENCTLMFNITTIPWGGIPPCDYEEVKVANTGILVTLYSLVFVLGLLGNGLVVCVLVKHWKQSNLTDICLFNLAVSDLVFVITLPFYSHFLVKGYWTFGNFMCHVLSGLHRTGFFSSIFFMVIMTLDRYIVIVHGHKVAQYRTMRLTIALTIITWILSLCVSLPSFILAESEDECLFLPENEHWHHYDLFATNVLGLILPLLVMVVSYSRIIPVLVKMKTAKRHRIVKLILSIVAVFFLFWAPYNISFFLNYLHLQNIIILTCNGDRNLRLAVSVTEAFAYTHCCLNPIIYAFVGQKFMRRTLQMLKKWLPISVGDLSDSSSRRSSVVSRSSGFMVTTM